MGIPIMNDEDKALLEVGFIRPIDTVLLCLIAITWFLGGSWWFFQARSIEALILVLIISMTLLLIWILSIVYRSCYFAIKCLALLKTLPDSAAKLAASQLLAGPLQQTK